MLELSTSVCALAQVAPCEPLDETTFVATIEAGHQFIASEDIAGYRLSSTLLQTRISCLAFVPRPEDWARYLIGEAAVAYFQGEDWESPLTTALSVAPDIDRGVSEDHAIASFVPPAPSPGDPLSASIEMYVDGQPASTVPPPQGLHLVQVREAETLRSILLRDAPVPADWLDRQSAGSQRASDENGQLGQIGGAAAIGWGYRELKQVVDRPGEFLPTGALYGMLGAGSLEVWAFRPVGVTLDVFSNTEPRLDASLFVDVRSSHVAAGLGAALLHVVHVEIDAPVRTLLPSPAAFLSAYGRTLDGRLSVAAGAFTLGRFSADLGVRMGNGPVRFRTGLSGRLVTASFAQSAKPPAVGRQFASNDWSALLNAGISWSAL